MWATNFISQDISIKILMYVDFSQGLIIRYLKDTKVIIMSMVIDAMVVAVKFLRCFCSTERRLLLRG